MTETLTTPDVTTDVDVDLDAEVACEVKEVLTNGVRIFSEKPCDLPADWAGRYPCCARLAILCDSHMANRKTTFLCKKCHHKFHPTELLGAHRL